MKNLILLFFCFPLLAFAQEEYKATEGEHTLELQLTPIGNNPININGIRFRKFLSDATTFRMNAFLGFNSNTQIKQQADDAINTPELTIKSAVLTLNVKPGFEKHLAVTERLSPYFGGEVDFALQQSSGKEQFENTNGDVFETNARNQSGYFRIGLNAIAGLDYYVAKKLYLGTEIGFGFSYTGLSDLQFESDELGFQEPDPIERGGSFNLGPNVNAQIRLGYAF